MLSPSTYICDEKVNKDVALMFLIMTDPLSLPIFWLPVPGFCFLGVKI